MMVQPLIENAIHHGLRNSDKKDLLLKVAVEIAGDTLRFTVTDNGAGLEYGVGRIERNTAKQKSFGLKMIRERIAIINQSERKDIARFALARDGDLTIATLILPVFPG